MSTLTVRWRPSGGRGEFEFVPSNSLVDRDVVLFIEPLDLTIPAEVRGEIKDGQGKPRLRKFEPNNRKKLHLPQLVMAVARLPEPAREDIHKSVSFPLSNKSYLVDSIDFDVIDDDGMTVTVSPLRVSILHSDFKIDLNDRFRSISHDILNMDKIIEINSDLGNAIKKHADVVKNGVNSLDIKLAADVVNRCEFENFGLTNASSITEAIRLNNLSETDLDGDIQGIEGRLLYRWHAYKERDRMFAELSKRYYKSINGGKLVCTGCGLDPLETYGDNGERCIEAHHKIPIEEIQPDSVTSVDEMAMVCANCHRIIHSRKPCLTLNELRALLAEAQSNGE